MAPDPCIAIVGAGIAGLSLAIMLERAGMHHYMIFERGPEYRSSGSAIVLSAMMLRCFEQLGMLEELIAVSKPMTGAVFLDENMKFIGSLPSIFIGQRYVFICFMSLLHDMWLLGSMHSSFFSVSPQPSPSSFILS
jgi:2-polyprenyl-6-methoxyphenol hydroxylase-like FAD-dependent oxidoreductase